MKEAEEMKIQRELILKDLDGLPRYIRESIETLTTTMGTAKLQGMEPHQPEIQSYILKKNISKDQIQYQKVFKQKVFDLYISLFKIRIDLKEDKYQTFLLKKVEILSGSKKAIELLKYEYYYMHLANKLNETFVKPYRMCIVNDGGVSLVEMLLEDPGEALWERRKLITGDDLCVWFRQLFEALFILQMRNLYHLDLTPHSLFVKNNNIKILEFGTYFSLIGNTLFTSPDTRELIGTLLTRKNIIHFQAPEILQEELTEDFNPNRADVYSLGISLYKIISKCSLLELEVELRHRRGNRQEYDLFSKKVEKLQIQKIDQNNDEYYTPRLVKVLVRMLDKCPRRRPSFGQLYLWMCQIHHVTAHEFQDNMKETIHRSNLLLSLQETLFTYLLGVEQQESSAYKEAHSNLGKALVAYQNIPWDTGLKIINIKKSLAINFYNMGFIFKSTTEFNKIIRILEKKKRSTKLDPHLIGIYLYLGHICFIQSQYEEAKSYYLKSVALGKCYFGSFHLETGFRYMHLGRNSNRLLEFKEGEKYLMKANFIFSQITGGRSIPTATLYLYLGELYISLREFSIAISYVKRGMNILQEDFSYNSLLIAEGYKILGDYYQAVGDYDISISYYKKSMRVFNELDENMSLKIAEIYASLSKLEFTRKNYYEASHWIGEYIELANILYDNAQATLELSYYYYLWSQCFAYRKEFKQSANCYHQAISMQFKDKHDQKAIQKYEELYILYMKFHNYTEARGVYKTIIKILGKRENLDKIRYLKYYEIIGDLAYKEGLNNKSLKYYTKYLELTKKIAEKNMVNYCRCLYKIGKIYNILSEYEKSEEKLEEARKIIEEIFGTSNYKLIMCYEQLGHLMRAQEEWKSSIKYYKKALDIVKSNSIFKRGYEIPIIHASIGLCYINKGKYSKAIKQLEKTMNLVHKVHKQEKLLKNDWDIFEENEDKSYVDLDFWYSKLGWLYMIIGNPITAAYFYRKQLTILQGEEESTKYKGNRMAGKDKSISLSLNQLLQNNYLNLGETYFEAENYSLSFELYNRAFELTQPKQGQEVVPNTTNTLMTEVLDKSQTMTNTLNERISVHYKRKQILNLDINTESMKVGIFTTEEIEQSKLEEKEISQIDQNTIDIINAKLYEHMGLCEIMLGHISEGIKLFKQSKHLVKKVDLESEERMQNLMRIYEYLGLIYENMKEFRNSAKYYKKSFIYRSKLAIHSDIEPMCEISNLLIHAKICISQDKTSKGITTAEKAQKLLKQNKGNKFVNYINRARAIIIKTRIKGDLGEVKEAKEYLKYNEDKLSKHLKSKNYLLSRVYGLIGNFSFQLKDYGQAATYLEKELRILESTIGKNNLILAPKLEKLGELYLKFDRYSSALVSYLRAIKITKKLITKPELIKKYEHLIELTINKQDFDKSNKYLGKVLQLQVKIDQEEGKYSNNLGSSMAKLGSFYTYNNKYLKGKDLYLNSINIREYNDDVGASLGHSLYLLGKSAQKEGHLETANLHLKKALLIFNEAFLEDNYLCEETKNALMEIEKEQQKKEKH